MDGRLSCDEFVLAMHLCDIARAGEKLPDVLTQELIPPSFRRPSLPATSANILVSPKGGSTPEAIAQGSIVTSPTTSEDLKVTSPVSFEDKRKENFDKGKYQFEMFCKSIIFLKRRLNPHSGQAELDKRRKALAEQQRREQEERERKEREEMERREKLRLEQERRQQAEMEKKLAKQREIEMVVHRMRAICNRNSQRVGFYIVVFLGKRRAAA